VTEELNEDKSEPEIFGLPLDRFKAAIEAMVDLRDSGKLLFFLTRRGWVRLVGDNEEFMQKYAELAKDKLIDIDKAKRAQSEIQSLISAILRISNIEGVLDHLERYHREDFRSKKELKIEFRARQRSKIEIATEKIDTHAMRQRSMRLATATGACVEEMDYEIVSEREDSFRERSVKDPFLRFRLRYTEGSKSEMQYLGFFFSAEGPEPTAPVFEFECDTSDIDLLIKRLTEAKDRLLQVGAARNGDPDV